MTKFTAVLLLAIGIAIPANAQTRADLLRPFFGYYDSQSLPTSIGRATIAAGQVIPGRSSNPANYGLSRFSTVQVNFLSGKFKNPDHEARELNFGSVQAILPMKVYRGSLAIALGVQKDVDFTQKNSVADSVYAEEGGMHSAEFAASVEFQRNFFIGASVKYLNGGGEAHKSDAESSSLLKPDYQGIGATAGFLQRVSPHLQFGASLDLPTWVWTEEGLTKWRRAQPNEESYDVWRYRMRKPITLHFGFALLYRAANLFYELEITDWSGARFASDSYFDSDITDINNELSDLRRTATHHLGSAFHLPWLPLHLYAGYQYMPVPYGGVYAADERESLSVGGAYMLNQQFSLHASYSNYFWRYFSVSESFQQGVFGVSLHF